MSFPFLEALPLEILFLILLDLSLSDLRLISIFSNRLRAIVTPFIATEKNDSRLALSESRGNIILSYISSSQSDSSFRFKFVNSCHFKAYIQFFFTRGLSLPIASLCFVNIPVPVFRKDHFAIILSNLPHRLNSLRLRVSHIAFCDHLFAEKFLNSKLTNLSLIFDGSFNRKILGAVALRLHFWLGNQNSKTLERFYFCDYRLALPRSCPANGLLNIFLSCISNNHLCYLRELFFENLTPDLNVFLQFLISWMGLDDSAEERRLVIPSLSIYFKSLDSPDFFLPSFVKKVSRHPVLKDSLFSAHCQLHLQTSSRKSIHFILPYTTPRQPCGILKLFFTPPCGDTR